MERSKRVPLVYDPHKPLRHKQLQPDTGYILDLIILRWAYNEEAWRNKKKKKKKKRKRWASFLGKVV